MKESHLIKLKSVSGKHKETKRKQNFHNYVAFIKFRRQNTAGGEIRIIPRGRWTRSSMISTLSLRYLSPASVTLWQVGSCTVKQNIFYLAISNNKQYVGIFGAMFSVRI